MVKVQETDHLIDPLDFRFENGRHEAIRRTGQWVHVHFVEHCFWCPEATETARDLVQIGRTGDGTAFGLNERNVSSKRFVHPFSEYEIDSTQLVFCYLPDDKKPLYNRIKSMSNHFGGIPSQCAVMGKFEKQGNRKDQ